MAGNGKATVISLAKYNAVEEAALKMQKELSKLRQQNSVLQSMVESRPLRRELDLFANEMERVLRYNDGTKGNTYRKKSIGYFVDKILQNLVQMPRATEVDDAGDGLMLRPGRVMKIAVNMANYSMMIGTLAMVEAGKMKLE